MTPTYVECPSCGGFGVLLLHDGHPVCLACDGTGQIPLGGPIKCVCLIATIDTRENP